MDGRIRPERASMRPRKSRREDFAGCASAKTMKYLRNTAGSHQIAAWQRNSAACIHASQPAKYMAFPAIYYAITVSSLLRLVVWRDVAARS
jgi:hypothetical protein